MYRTVLTFLGLALALPAFGQNAGFQTKAPHAVIMDYETGEVLYEKGARAAIAPASMTKIMTADMVFEALKNGTVTPDTEFQVSEEAWRRGGVKSGSSTMFLKVKSSVRVEDLLRGIIIQSGNDACIVVAEGLAGSETEFADQMTARAKAIGLESASFRNSTGWPHPEHKISAFDLAQLARHSIKTYPEYYSIYGEKSFTWNEIKQGNRNPLLGKFTGADGMKTGSTEASGYGLVGSAERAGKRRIVVINGLESKSDRADVSLRLMSAAFSQFKIYQLYKSGDVIGDVDVYMGAAEKVKVRIDENVQAGIFRGDRAKISSIMMSKPAVAPITVGDHIADMIISVPGREDKKIALFATEDIKAKSLFAKAWTILLQKIRA